MATYPSLIAHALRELPGQIKTCEQVGQALVEIGATWARAQAPTEYDRARKIVTDSLDTTLRRLSRLRRQVLSAEAIRTSALLMRMRTFCQQCPQANRKALKSSKQFLCPLGQRLEKGNQAVFAFRLDEEGQIVERRGWQEGWIVWWIWLRHPLRVAPGCGAPHLAVLGQPGRARSASARGE